MLGNVFYLPKLSCVCVCVRVRVRVCVCVCQDPFFCHLPFLAGILFFLTLHLGLTSMRATASRSYEGLVAAAKIGIIAILKHIGCAW